MIGTYNGYIIDSNPDTFDFKNEFDISTQTELQITVIEDTADEAYRVAVEENKLEVVSRPELDVKQIGKDKDLIYTVTVYVKPEATVKMYKGLEIEKFDTTVTEHDIEHELFHIREKNARTITVVMWRVWFV